MTDPGTGRGSVELPQRVDGGPSLIVWKSAAVGGERSFAEGACLNGEVARRFPPLVGRRSVGPSRRQADTSMPPTRIRFGKQKPRACGLARSNGGSKFTHSRP